MANFPMPRDVPVFLQDIRNEFDKLLDRVWHGGINSPPLDGQDWAPMVDVIDEPLGYRIRVEVPGLSVDDIDVSIHKSRLSIKGRKSSPQQPGEHPRYLRSECRYGSFCREFDLPVAVQEEGVKATCRNGVLMVEVPKAPAPAGKNVKIDAEPPVG
jgi:HSP20 family protein